MSGHTGLLASYGSSAISNPSTILGADLIAWWDPSDTGHITLNGSTVASWTDRTGNYTASQANTSLQPAYSSTARNGKPGIIATTGPETLIFDSTGFPSGNDPIYFAIKQYTEITSNQGLFAYGSPTAQVVVYITGTQLAVYDVNSRIISNTIYPAFIDVFAEWQHPASGNDILYANGVAGTPAAISWNTVPGYGAIFDQVYPFIVTPGTVIQPIVVCNRVLTAPEQAAMQAWAATQ